jgi:tetratricopeptide (TPR) repeat protein
MSSCGQRANRVVDEEREPYYLKGQEYLRQLNHEDAIKAFHQALEVNPRSSAAHKELGILYEKHENDPAAAIYHYRRFLKLNSNSPIANDISDRVAGCQIDLVEEMKDSGANDRRRKEIADLKDKLTHLTQQFEKVRHENDVLRKRLMNINPRLANVTPPPTPTKPAVPIISPVSKTKAQPHKTAPVSSRQHKVKPNDNPTKIARKYAIPLQRLMAANPDLNPRRMQVGQMLKIPAVQP